MNDILFTVVKNLRELHDSDCRGARNQGRLDVILGRQEQVSNDTLSLWTVAMIANRQFGYLFPASMCPPSRPLPADFVKKLTGGRDLPASVHLVTGICDRFRLYATQFHTPTWNEKGGYFQYGSSTSHRTGWCTDWRLFCDGHLEKWRGDIDLSGSRSFCVSFACFDDLLKHFSDGCKDDIYKQDIWNCELPLGWFIISLASYFSSIDAYDRWLTWMNLSALSQSSKIAARKSSVPPLVRSAF